METLLIIGAGDVATRALPALVAAYDVHALTRDQYHAEGIAALGARPVIGDLDDPASLETLAGLADRVAHLAPPPGQGSTDARTHALLSVLGRRAMVAQPGAAKSLKRLIYISTTGVYGDCGGALVDETRPVNPQNDRARRRVDAERAIGAFAQARGVSHAILRVPGIYAADRLPIERLKRGTPALRPEDDVYTNHIHADDLAMILVRAIATDAARGVFNVADESEMKMGDYFDLVADRFGLPRPPRIARADAAGRIDPMVLSFMRESRRIDARRLRDALGLRLRYPTVLEGVPSP